MDTVTVLALLVAYFWGVGKLIHWACRTSGAEVPGWLDTIGMLLWPRLIGRFTVWVIPDAWGWPEPWISVIVWLVAMLAMLRWYFKIDWVWALSIWMLITIYGVVTVMRAAPYLPAKSPPAAAPAPAAPAVAR